MWCIKNKLNNKNDALLLDTQQNDLISSSNIYILKNRNLFNNNRFFYSHQFQIKPSGFSLKKIRLEPSLISYKIITNYNYAQNLGMK